MRVTTFYSYKGGVGRTLACANYGLYLAKTGQKVVLADMDFEAPGLDSKFPNLDAAGFPGGLLDQFSAFQRGGPIPELAPVEIPLPDDVVRSGGRLQLLPAGNYLGPGYYQKLANLEWDLFLHEKRGLAFCLDLVRRIEQVSGADVLVIDSRTGLTEVGGLCTQVLPDTVLLFTCASPESLAGTRRIYERVSQSPIVKARARGRTSVDLRVVIARMPRPKDPSALDQSMKKRLGIDVDRLHYLFDEPDLSVEEYLALDHFAEEPPAILGDYVELFVSFHPETSTPYIEKRLEAFRSGVTRRSPQENERLIQELITLFPLPQVILEAARYYRIAKGGDRAAVANYIRYLSLHEDDAEALSEFAELCRSVPEGELKPPDAVGGLLRRFGAERMDAELIARFFKTTSSKEDRREIVAAIERDAAKLRHDDFRTTYLMALQALGEWSKIIAAVADQDLETSSIGVRVAEAHLALGDLDAARKILSRCRIKSPEELIPILRILYQIEPDAAPAEIDAFLTRIEPWGSRALRYIMHERGVSEDPRFGRWLLRLSERLNKE